jgi:hypothetical protein
MTTNVLSGLSGIAFAVAVGDPQKHGLLQSAVEIARPLGFPVTNSMLVSWIVAALLIVFARVATRGMDQVPAGLRTFSNGWSKACISFWRASSAAILSTERYGSSARSSSWPPTGSVSCPASDRWDRVRAGHDTFLAVGEGRTEARLREKISDEEVASVNASLVRSLAALQVKRRRRKS